MTEPAREQILGGLATALANVTKANGYYFNLGSNLYRALPQVNTTPCIVLFDGQGTVVEVPRYHRHTLPITLEGHISLDTEAPTQGTNVRNILANRILADLMAGVNAEFEMSGVVVNLVSYATDHPTELSDSVAASVVYNMIFHTPRTDPLTLLEI